MSWKEALKSIYTVICSRPKGLLLNSLNSPDQCYKQAHQDWILKFTKC